MSIAQPPLSAGGGIEFDHVVIAVADLDVAAREFEARHGLASTEGGRHPGWGTANRIVPLGDTYLELATVVDRGEAAGNPFGRWVATVGTSPALPLGWVVRTAGGLDDLAARLGLAVTTGSRRRGDGTLLRWRLAGVEQAAADPVLPFLIEWGEGTPYPGRAVAAHPAGAVAFEQLELSGDAGRLAGWLGTHRLPITVRPGAPAIDAVVLAGDAGRIVLPRIP